MSSPGPQISEREATKAAHAFDTWPAADFTASTGRRVPAFLPPAELGAVAGLRLHHRTPLPGTRSFSDQLLGGEGVAVSMTIDERATAQDAREALIDRLLDVMAPRLPDCAQPLGEVCFQGVDDPPSSVMFVRGNVLVVLASVGSEPVDVRALAARLDEALREHLRSLVER